MRISIACAAALVPLACFGAPALAQDPNPEAAVMADRIDEGAIITVRGRQELRFAAPVSSVRIAGDDAAGLLTLDEVTAAVPGLWMINDQDPGTNIVSLRGVTTDRLQQAAVVYVLDGVPLADTEFFTGPLFDLQAVTVLRGPQGALFGKGAAGGVIAVDSAQPHRVGYGRLGVGDGGYRIAEGAASFTLGPAWRGRVSGQWRAAEGWITNRTLGRVVDAEESRALRLRLLGDVFGPESLDLGLFVMEDDGGAAWASSGDVTGDFGGELDGPALTDPIGDFEGRASRQWIQARARATLGTSLGDVSLLLAHDAYRKRWVEELDYRPGPLTFFGAPAFPDGLQPIAQPTDIDATTLEARLAGSVGSADYVLGVLGQFVDRRRTDDFGPLLFGGPALAYDTDSLQTALFGGFSHAFGAWRFEAQARFDRDDRSQEIRAAGVLRERREAAFERFQPRLAVSFAPSERVTAFASYGEGFRSGGFNPAPLPGSVWQAQFEPEITRSVEAGVRVRDFDATGELAWRLEAVAFSSAIDQYQNYTFLDGQSVTLTVDAVSVDGLELTGELSFAPDEAWTLGLSGGWALAETTIDRHIAPDPLAAGRMRDYSGNRAPNAPAWTGHISGSADWVAGRTHAMGIGLTLNGAGEAFYEIDNALRSPPRAWLDAQAIYRIGPWSVTLKGRNITDERWAISAFGQGMLPLLQGLGPGGPFDTFTINRGRQVSVSLRRDF
jgi:iron complex outermembrane receptor protein